MKNKYLKFASITAGVAWLGITAIVSANQRKLIFKPEKLVDTSVARASSHRSRKIVVRGRGDVKLSGILIRPYVASGSAVIYFGGRSEDVTWIHEAAASMFPGMVVLAVNYRGYGMSGGTPGELDLVRDGADIFDWFQALTKLPNERISITGRSLGTGVAVQVAVKRKPGALCLITPYDSIAAVAQRKFPLIPMFLLRHKFNSALYASLVKCPVLIVRAATDTVVEPKRTDRLAASFAVPVRQITIQNTNHSDIPFNSVTHEQIAAYLASQFSEQRISFHT